jgi:preprotein translocase subunit SecB
VSREFLVGNYYSYANFLDKKRNKSKDNIFKDNIIIRESKKTEKKELFTSSIARAGTFV